jgi:hypothetical protein
MVAAFGLLVAVCASCAGGYSRADRLQLRVDQFNNQVRWGRFHSAAEFFRDEEARRAWLDVRREWGQDLQIADYEIVESAEGDDGTTVVRVVVSWYRLSQSELHTTMFAQRWRLEDREWHLLSEEVEEGTPL